MDDRAALLRAIADQPADRTARLVYADLLDEGGRPVDVARAEFVRTQVEAQTVHPNSVRARKLLFRGRELFAAHWADWWEPVCTAVGLPVVSRDGPRGVRGWLARQFRAGAEPDSPYGVFAHDRFTVHTTNAAGPGAPVKIAFAGGFPEALTFNGQLHHSADLLRRWANAAPLAALDLRGIVGRDWRAIDGPHLGGVRALALGGGVSAGLEAVAASPHLPQLEQLHLAPDRSNVHWPGDQYRAFARSALAPRVRRLGVTLAAPEEARKLAGAPLRNVTALTIGAAHTVTDPGEVDRTCRSAAELIASPLLRGLDELVLDGVTSHALAETGPGILARVRRLDLSPNHVLRPTFPLAPNGHFGTLEDLTLVIENCPAAWIEALADHPCVGRLRHLRLGGSLQPTSDAVLAVLRLARVLDSDRLETLHVGARVCNAEPVRLALAELFGARARFG